MEIQEHDNWYTGHTYPVWKDQYKDLTYINEPFNDPISLKEWRELGYTQTKFTGDMYDMRQLEPKWMNSLREHFPWKYFSWGSPSNANFSMTGPPGYPNFIAFATLSKHSPAESSMVEPSVINFLALFTRTRAVFPPDTSKHK